MPQRTTRLRSNTYLPVYTFDEYVLLLTNTVDADTTRYIDLNDPANPATAGDNAGKNPQGIVINKQGTRAYVQNFVSRNVSVVDLTHRHA